MEKKKIADIWHFIDTLIVIVIIITTTTIMHFLAGTI